MCLMTFLRRLVRTAPADGGGPTERIRVVDPATAVGWLEQGAATIVDVREPQEHRSAHIPGARLNPLSSFDPAAVPVEPGKALILHCQSGKRCGPAAERMMAAGFSGTVYRLKGGMAAWIAAGGPIEQ